jgi:hypothetical protein
LIEYEPIRVPLKDNDVNNPSQSSNGGQKDWKGHVLEWVVILILTLVLYRPFSRYIYSRLGINVPVDSVEQVALVPILTHFCTVYKSSILPLVMPEIKLVSNQTETNETQSIFYPQWILDDLWTSVAQHICQDEDGAPVPALLRAECAAFKHHHLLASTTYAVLDQHALPWLTGLGVPVRILSEYVIQRIKDYDAARKHPVVGPLQGKMRGAGLERLTKANDLYEFLARNIFEEWSGSSKGMIKELQSLEHHVDEVFKAARRIANMKGTESSAYAGWVLGKSVRQDVDGFRKLIADARTALKEADETRAKFEAVLKKARDNSWTLVQGDDMDEGYRVVLWGERELQKRKRKKRDNNPDIARERVVLLAFEEDEALADGISGVWIGFLSALLKAERERKEFDEKGYQRSFGGSWSKGAMGPLQIGNGEGY